jgi:hypothetical protein
MPWSRAFFLTHFLEKNVHRVFTTTPTKKTQQKQKTVQKDSTIEGEFWEE